MDDFLYVRFDTLVTWLWPGLPTSWREKIEEREKEKKGEKIISLTSYFYPNIWPKGRGNILNTISRKINKLQMISACRLIGKLYVRRKIS